MLSNHLKKLNTLLSAHKTDLSVAFLIFLASMASFGLGRLSSVWPKKEPITVTENDKLQMLNAESKNRRNVAASSFIIQNSALSKYVASKSGSAYHFPWCAGAQKIKDKNKILFNSKEEAEKAGYKPAGNCPGL
ncbi:MAG: hypothetical protein HYW90_01760 [Candidatus Sungbacteria bacterium]|nr:hypothetical protein [Candidatus Sungbacteria bacterium]